jgi:NADP-dependent 3-hydroxy acid dehydrogenase YdfG
MVDLNNKIIVITGASSGIGQALVNKLASFGPKLVLAARRSDRLDSIRNSLQDPSKCLCVPTDVTDQQNVKFLFEETAKYFGPVDILINNAGVGRPALLSETNLGQWKRIIDTNLSGVYMCTRQAVLQMLNAQNPGHIITVSSIAGKFVLPGYSAYCASKHGVSAFMRALKTELRKCDIKCSTIHPARVDTEFFEPYNKKPPKRQMLKPDDIADYIVALASQDSAGQVKIALRNFGKRIYHLIAG